MNSFNGVCSLLLVIGAVSACSSDPERAPSAENMAGAAGKSDAGSANRAGASSGEGGAAGDSIADAGAAGEGAGGSGGVGGNAGAAALGPASCQDSSETCGSKHESCCKSLALPGQSFYRSYDGISSELKDQGFPAAVSGFRLDAFEVTVSRFRRFVTATVAGYRPEAGAGKHTHLNEGRGLSNVGAAAGNENGWDEAWSARLDGTGSDWDARLGECEAPSWSSVAAEGERLPIACLSWYEAYAFCIWDGGFLPSEAEWNDAASGGSQQRVYPWSSPASSLTISCTNANFAGAAGPDFCVAPGVGGLSNVGATNAGNGLWGHADLAGNVFEWTLDAFASYAPACADCFDGEGEDKAIRGGGYTNTADLLASGLRNSSAADSRSKSLGVRCARTP